MKILIDKFKQPEFLRSFFRDRVYWGIGQAAKYVGLALDLRDSLSFFDDPGHTKIFYILKDVKSDSTQKIQ